MRLREQPLELTSEEFDVLLFLLDHPQRLVTPRTLLATNCNKYRFRQTEFLRALLSLRVKIDAVEPGKPYLRTEPWILYCFEPAPAS